jgi:hypothetical protein
MENPSCLHDLRDGRYYKNSNGLDEYIVKNATPWLHKQKITYSYYHFMIANDPLSTTIYWWIYRSKSGKAFFTGLQGQMIFHGDYEANRKKAFEVVLSEKSEKWKVKSEKCCLFEQSRTKVRWIKSNNYNNKRIRKETASSIKDIWT